MYEIIDPPKKKGEIPLFIQVVIGGAERLSVRRESIVQPALFEMGDDVIGQIDSDVSTYDII